MREEVIFRMESAYREDFEVKSYHFGGPEKTMCIIGNMRGNEIQQLYIAGQMVRTLKRFEEEGRFIRRHGVTVIPCANPYSVNVGKRFWAMDNSDINRMYPGYNKGETTQRIAAGIFEKIQGYRFGVQFSSFLYARRLRLACAHDEDGLRGHGLGSAFRNAVRGVEKTGSL